MRARKVLARLVAIDAPVARMPQYTSTRVAGFATAVRNSTLQAFDGDHQKNAEMPCCRRSGEIDLGKKSAAVASTGPTPGMNFIRLAGLKPFPVARSIAVEAMGPTPGTNDTALLTRGAIALKPAARLEKKPLTMCSAARACSSP